MNSSKFSDQGNLACMNVWKDVLQFLDHREIMQFSILSKACRNIYMSSQKFWHILTKKHFVGTLQFFEYNKLENIIILNFQYKLLR